jgi:hypothetical protein
VLNTNKFFGTKACNSIPEVSNPLLTRILESGKFFHAFLALKLSGNSSSESEPTSLKEALTAHDALKWQDAIKHE